MPRIEGIDPEKASETTKARMKRDVERVGFVMPGTGITGHAPSIQEGTAALDAGITAAGGIPRRRRRATRGGRNQRRLPRWRHLHRGPPRLRPLHPRRLRRRTT